MEEEKLLGAEIESINEEVLWEELLNEGTEEDVLIGLEEDDEDIVVLAEELGYLASTPK